MNGTRESATFDTKTQARAWASKRETELRELSRGKLPDYTLNCAIDRYIEEVCPKHKGCDSEIKRFKAFQKNFPKLCKKHIVKITTDDFVTWRDERLKKVKPASVRREGNILSALFTVARTEWKWVYESPMSDLKMPPPPAHRDRRISEDEIERLCLAADFNNQKPENFTQQIMIAFQSLKEKQS